MSALSGIRISRRASPKACIFALYSSASSACSICPRFMAWAAITFNCLRSSFGPLLRSNALIGLNDIGISFDDGEPGPLPIAVSRLNQCDAAVVMALPGAEFIDHLAGDRAVVLEWPADRQ